MPSTKSKARSSRSKKPKKAARGALAAGAWRRSTSTWSARAGRSSSRTESSLARAVVTKPPTSRVSSVASECAGGRLGVNSSEG